MPGGDRRDAPRPYGVNAIGKNDERCRTDRPRVDVSPVKARTCEIERVGTRTASLQFGQNGPQENAATAGRVQNCQRNCVVREPPNDARCHEACDIGGCVKDAFRPLARSHLRRLGPQHHAHAAAFPVRV